VKTMFSNAQAWLETLMAERDESAAQRDAEDLDKASPTDEEEPKTVEEGEANPGSVDLTGAPAVQNMFCITCHST
jgi:hypothetical protein